MLFGPSDVLALRPEHSSCAASSRTRLTWHQALGVDRPGMLSDLPSDVAVCRFWPPLLGCGRSPGCFLPRQPSSCQKAKHRKGSTGRRWKARAARSPACVARKMTQRRKTARRPTGLMPASRDSPILLPNQPKATPWIHGAPPRNPQGFAAVMQPMESRRLVLDRIHCRVLSLLCIRRTGLEQVVPAGCGWSKGRRGLGRLEGLGGPTAQAQPCPSSSQWLSLRLRSQPTSRDRRSRTLGRCHSIPRRSPATGLAHRVEAAVGPGLSILVGLAPGGIGGRWGKADPLEWSRRCFGAIQQESSTHLRPCQPRLLSI